MSLLKMLALLTLTRAFLLPVLLCLLFSLAVLSPVMTHHTTSSLPKDLFGTRRGPA